MDELAVKAEGLLPGSTAVIGLPLDENSSFLRGAAQAPVYIRQALHSGSTNLCTENGLDLGKDERWRDLGDLALGEGVEAFEQITRASGDLLDRGFKLMALGGDHSVTYPLLKAFGERLPSLTILHLDAHADIYDEYEGSRLSHACPFARIMEAGLAARLVQAGIRTLTSHQRTQIERFGVEVIEMRDWPPSEPLRFSEPVYLSLDMDAIDPAFAPGVSHHEPGGFTSREVLSIIHSLSGQLIGADLVELNPARDPLGITAALGAKLYKEIIASLLGSRP
jgi:arginase